MECDEMTMDCRRYDITIQTARGTTSTHYVATRSNPDDALSVLEIRDRYDFEAGDRVVRIRERTD